MSPIDAKKQKCILEKGDFNKKPQVVYKSFFVYHCGVTTAYSSRILDYKPKSAFYRRQNRGKIAKVL